MAVKMGSTVYAYFQVAYYITSTWFYSDKNVKNMFLSEFERSTHKHGYLAPQSM